MAYDEKTRVMLYLKKMYGALTIGSFREDSGNCVVTEYIMLLEDLKVIHVYSDSWHTRKYEDVPSLAQSYRFEEPERARRLEFLFYVVNNHPDEKLKNRVRDFLNSEWTDKEKLNLENIKEVEDRQERINVEARRNDELVVEDLGGESTY